MTLNTNVAPASMFVNGHNAGNYSYYALSGSNGQLRLTIANPDGSPASATNNLTAGFLPLPTEDNGNLFLGRYTYPVSVEFRDFSRIY